MKNYNKNKESSNLNFWDANILYECTMSQSLLVHGFKCIKKKSNVDLKKMTTMKIIL